ncbi:MAG: ABC transporter ATP-binding protein [Sphingomonadales bacterium]|nr:ABC transporter ATP-binding protein [Sphingomonadales bacterium]MDE2168272.1 ABC transporter ATP-binding protein [Sphingomonadales bacterium]
MNQSAAAHPAPCDEDVAIRIEGLVNRFGDHTVHDGLSLCMRQGEILGVVGGSGTGKSVLMRSIIGLQKPAEGTVEVLGEMMGEPAPDGDDIRRRWGVLFQGGALFSTLTVAENVAVPLREFYPRMSEDLLAEIGCLKVALSGLPEDAAAKYPSELSGGMKKRAGLARALALDPQLLFLDEPTAGLDPIAAAGFDRLIKELHETLGLSVFLITHDLDTLHEICDRVAVLADKKVIAVGTIPELMKSDHPWIQDYFAGPRGRAALASREIKTDAAPARPAAGNPIDSHPGGEA